MAPGGELMHKARSGVCCLQQVRCAGQGGAIAIRRCCIDVRPAHTPKCRPTSRHLTMKNNAGCRTVNALRSVAVRRTLRHASRACLVANPAAQVSKVLSEWLGVAGPFSPFRHCWRLSGETENDAIVRRGCGVGAIAMLPSWALRQRKHCRARPPAARRARGRARPAAIVTLCLRPAAGHVGQARAVLTAFLAPRQGGPRLASTAVRCRRAETHEGQPARHEAVLLLAPPQGDIAALYPRPRTGTATKIALPKRCLHDERTLVKSTSSGWAGGSAAPR